MAVAFAAAIAFTLVENGAAQNYAAGVFGFSIGAALLLWGIEELGQGSIRGKRTRIHRSDSPSIFVLLLLGKRIVPGVLMIGAAIWILFFKIA